MKWTTRTTKLFLLYINEMTEEEKRKTEKKEDKAYSITELYNILNSKISKQLQNAVYHTVAQSQAKFKKGMSFYPVNQVSGSLFKSIHTCISPCRYCTMSRSQLLLW